MKLVLYDNSNIVMNVLENIRMPTVSGNNVEWEDGSLSGINLPFCLLADEVTIDREVTDDIKARCLRDQYTKVDLVKENANLKARLAATEKEVEELKTLVGNP